MSTELTELHVEESGDIVVRKAPLRIPVKLLHPDAKAPTRAYEHDAGWDLTAIDHGSVDIDPESEKQRNTTAYRTGVAVAIPEGYVGLCFPRSSIRRTCLWLSNSVGVIDSGYRGEITATFRYDVEDEALDYQPGDRILQLVILPLPAVEFTPVDELPASERGTGGFGSSGR